MNKMRNSALFINLFGLFLGDKTSRNFAIGVLIGLAFSISVIVSTIGIMDGFDKTLKEGLRASSGDLIIYNKKRYFTSVELKKIFLKNKIKQVSYQLETEGFAIYDEQGRGVLLKGVDLEDYFKVTGRMLNFARSEIAIGSELARSFDLKVGDALTLALALGSHTSGGLPTLQRFKIGQIIIHGIYQKDLRYIYMPLKILQKLIGAGERVNLAILNIPKQGKSLKINQGLLSAIEDYKLILKNEIPGDYRVKAFWDDFSFLFEAVKIEKFMISLILQLVVVMAIFNLFAFIIFIGEKKSREIFLFKALGLSQKSLRRSWMALVVLIWGFSCLLSIGLVEIFAYILKNFTIFNLPGQIYYLGHLKLSLVLEDYLLVFMLSLVWILFIAWIVLWIRMRKAGILKGLRQEFS